MDKSITLPSRSITPQKDVPIGSEVKAIQDSRIMYSAKALKKLGSMGKFQFPPGEPVAVADDTEDDDDDEDASIGIISVALDDPISSGGVKLPAETMHERKTSNTSSISSSTTVTIKPCRRVESHVGESRDVLTFDESAAAPAVRKVGAGAEGGCVRGISPAGNLRLALSYPAPPAASPVFAAGYGMTASSPSVETMTAWYKQELSRVISETQSAMTQRFNDEKAAFADRMQSDISEKDRRHAAELAEKDQQIKEMVGTMGRMGAFMGEVTQKLQEAKAGEMRAEIALKQLTPTNQMVFYEPATIAYPIERQATPPTNPYAAHYVQAAPQKQPAYTYPGAHPPNDDYEQQFNDGSPRFISQPKGNAAAMRIITQDPNQYVVAANPDDNVFDDDGNGPGLDYFYQTIGLQQEGLHGLFNHCFSGIEAAIRSMPIVQMYGQPRYPQGVREFVTMCQEHITHRSEVYAMLAEPNNKYLLLTGVVHRVVCEKVLDGSFLAEYQDHCQTAVSNALSAEKTAYHEEEGNWPKRAKLGMQRAEIINLMAQAEGFRGYMRDYTGIVVDQYVMPSIAAAFPPELHWTLRQNLFKPIKEAMGLALRLLQDPRWYKFCFQAIGCPWNGDYMIQRNEELVGQEISNLRTPYAVRTTVRPLVKRFNLWDREEKAAVIHKAEVLLVERKRNLKPFLRPGDKGYDRYVRHRR